jgi:hypothetical protein
LEPLVEQGTVQGPLVVAEVEQVEDSLELGATEARLEPHLPRMGRLVLLVVVEEVEQGKAPERTLSVLLVELGGQTDYWSRLTSTTSKYDHSLVGFDKSDEEIPSGNFC